MYWVLPQISLSPVTSRDGDKNSLQEKKHLINPNDVSGSETEGTAWRLGWGTGKEGGKGTYIIPHIVRGKSKANGKGRLFVLVGLEQKSATLLNPLRGSGR